MAGDNSAVHECEQCGKTFERAPRKGRVHRFCSSECYGRNIVATKTNCANDHALTPENTIVLKDKRRCRTCHNEYQRRHTTTSTYREKVRDRYPVSIKDRQARRFAIENGRSRAVAFRNGYEWTGPELETAARTDLTARQVAEMLGRTVAAVHSARHKLRAEPREILLAGVVAEGAS